MFDSTIPALVAPAIGLGALAAGIWFGRRSARDTLAAAQRLSASTASYYVRARHAHRLVNAIESPTQAMDVTELRAAYATPVERLKDTIHRAAKDAVEAARPIQNPPDWAEGEMTATFRAIMQTEQWPEVPELEQPPAPIHAELYGNPVSLAPRPHEKPAPVLPPPPPIVLAPRGSQTPPRWQDRPAPPRRSRPLVAARTRAWRGPLLGLAVPPLELPALPAPFRMPEPRRRPTPARMAHLPQDDTRQFRVKVVAA